MFYILTGECPNLTVCYKLKIPFSNPKNQICPTISPFSMFFRTPKPSKTVKFKTTRLTGECPSIFEVKKRQIWSNFGLKKVFSVCNTVTFGYSPVQYPIYKHILIMYPLGLVSMVFKILNADYTHVPGMYSKGLSDLIDCLFRVEPELRPTAKQVIGIFTELMEVPAESHTLDEYDNDFDSLSDNSATTNLEDSQRMATSSLSQDTLTEQEIVVVNREISRQHSDCYSDDFDSFSENEDG